MERKWTKTTYPGIESRQHETRKHGVKFDTYYRGRFMVNGKKHNIGFGWASEGWTLKNVFTKHRN